jgi:hypothetical protein
MDAVFVVLLANCGAVTALPVYAFERLRRQP